MDVFSLLKFWRNAGIGDPVDFDFTDDEASFFDLVFTPPNNTDSVNVISGHFHKVSNFDGVDLKSPKTPLFFNNNTTLKSSSNTKSPFRVFMKPEKKDMKCQEIEQVTTISSLLKRDNSLRNKFNHDHTQSKLVHRYLNLIRPLYIKVSRRSNDKIRSPENTSFYTSPAVFSPRRKEDKPSVFKEVRKHLGKSRSSSSSSVVKPIPSPALRRDDSALQQQDGIQSAILHCKKSYTSPSQGCNLLSRSGSAPSVAGCRIFIDEEKRSSI